MKLTKNALFSIAVGGSAFLASLAHADVAGTFTIGDTSFHSYVGNIGMAVYEDSYAVTGAVTADWSTPQNFNFNAGASDGYYTFTPVSNGYQQYVELKLSLGAGGNNNTTFAQPSITFGGLVGSAPALSTWTAKDTAGGVTFTLRFTPTSSFSFSDINVNGTWSSSNVGSSTFNLVQSTLVAGAFAPNLSPDAAVLSFTASPAAIPEPSTWCLIAGFAALGGALLKRFSDRRPKSE